MSNSTWNFDPAHSGINFAVRHMVLAKVRGRFGGWSGDLQLDPGDLTRSRVAVEVEAASIDTGVAERDTHLRSPDFFDVERFPSLSFRSTRIEALGESRYQLHGELTIRDVTRNVVFEVEYAGTAVDPWGNERMAFAASTSIRRKDYGLTWNQVLEAGGVLIGDKIDIELDVQAIKTSAVQADLSGALS